MDFGIESDIDFNGQYVYYKRLLRSKEEGNRQLGQTMSQKLLDFSTVTGDKQNISAYFKAMAESEYSKELALLTRLLGSEPTNYNFEDDKNGRKMIDTLNAILGLKEVYERDLEVLLSGDENQRTVISFFSSYVRTCFNKAYKEGLKAEEECAAVPCLSKLILEKAKENPKTEIATLAKEVIQKYWIDIIRHAAKNTLRGTSKREDDKLFRQALRSLTAAQGKLSAEANRFVADLAKIFNLDDIIRVVTENLENGSDKEMRKKLDRFFAGANKRKMWIYGGQALEAYISYITNEVVAGTFGKNATIASRQSGGTKQKADTIITVDLDIGVVENWLETENFGTREKNRRAILGLQKQLANADDSFIVYTNTKNYSTEGTKFKRSGFSAGEPIKLDTFSSITSSIPKASQLVVAIMNLTPGALNENNKQLVKDSIARAVATFLFDDFETIGNNMSADSGAKAIHLFNLNNIYVPLSWFFYHLSLAFGGTEKTTGLVQVDLKFPKNIMFPTQQKQNAWKRKNLGQSAWHEQASWALDNSTVAIHFLSSIQKLLKI